VFLLSFFIIGNPSRHFVYNTKKVVRWTDFDFCKNRHPVTLFTRDADWHKLVTDLFYDFVGILLVWVAKCFISNNNCRLLTINIVSFIFSYYRESKPPFCLHYEKSSLLIHGRHTSMECMCAYWGSPKVNFQNK
jgi:hypothetical protein